MWKQPPKSNLEAIVNQALDNWAEPVAGPALDTWVGHTGPGGLILWPWAAVRPLEAVSREQRLLP